jgi:hypothetical protein
MVELFHDSYYKGWAVYQIIQHAQLNDKLFVSVGTAYKYYKVLGLANRKIYKKKQAEGIRASAPNEIWHMDVTQYKCTDGVIVYIYILMDNYSRFILNWKAATYLDGQISRSMVKGARELYLPPESSALSRQTMLLVDGGPENNNKDIDTYLASVLVPIRKFIAQKDIIYSNSMVEAVNKKLKYQHLFPFNSFKYDKLLPHLKIQIPEYNTVRPHYAHKFSTPAQVYFGNETDMEEVRAKLGIARKKRIIENQMVDCPVCS